MQFITWTDPPFQRLYRFRPATSESRSGYWLISNPSYMDPLTGPTQIRINHQWNFSFVTSNSIFI
jgi:hypothetical protein